MDSTTRTDDDKTAKSESPTERIQLIMAEAFCALKYHNGMVLNLASRMQDVQAALMLNLDSPAHGTIAAATQRLKAILDRGTPE